jgi:tRNA A37 threonylcarbamoyladenosine dehydratase
MSTPPFLQRLALITGAEALAKIARQRVYVFGLGGVGSWAAEALVRSGVVNMTLVDSDMVCVTNINRQSEALPRTVGMAKTAALAERLLEINPACKIRAIQRVFCREDAAEFDLDGADYVIDAIDSLTHKTALIEETLRREKKLFSSMGMAQKLDPSQIRAASIWQTQGCPLARLVRQQLRKNGFSGDFTAVFSPEKLPLQKSIKASCGGGGCLCPARKAGTDCGVEWCSSKKVINGSSVMVTAAAGMMLASLVVRDVCGGDVEKN